MFAYEKKKSSSLSNGPTSFFSFSQALSASFFYCFKPHLGTVSLDLSSHHCKDAVFACWILWSSWIWGEGEPFLHKKKMLKSVRVFPVYCIAQGQWFELCSGRTNELQRSMPHVWHFLCKSQWVLKQQYVDSWFKNFLPQSRNIRSCRIRVNHFWHNSRRSIV